MTGCTIEGPHLIERCEDPRSSSFPTGVINHTPRPPKPPAPTFPPRDLHSCQAMLRECAALLEDWNRLGKGHGLHGMALQAVLDGRRSA